MRGKFLEREPARNGAKLATQCGRHSRLAADKDLHVRRSVGKILHQH